MKIVLAALLLLSCAWAQVAENANSGYKTPEGRQAVATWSGRSRATLLINPGALGRLRWLLLATEGLDPPAWLLRAASAPA